MEGQEASSVVDECCVGRHVRIARIRQHAQSAEEKVEDQLEKATNPP